MTKLTFSETVKQQVVKQVTNLAVDLSAQELEQLVNYACQLYMSGRTPRKVRQEIRSFLETQTQPLQL